MLDEHILKNDCTLCTQLSPPDATLSVAQELLNHQFLRPSTRTALAEKPDKGSVGLTKEQLRTLIAHVSAAGSNADVDTLSEKLFAQLAEGNAAGLGALLSHPVGTQRFCGVCMYLSCF